MFRLEGQIHVVLGKSFFIVFGEQPVSSCINQDNCRTFDRGNFVRSNWQEVFCLWQMYYNFNIHQENSTTF